MDQLLFLFELIYDFISEIRNTFIKIAFYIRTCELCIVAHRCNIRMIIRDRIDANDRQKSLVLAVDADIAPDRFINQVDKLVIVRNTHEEMISPKITGEIAFHLLNTKQILTNIGKQDISGFLTVPVIK